MTEVVFQDVHKIYIPEKGPEAHAVRGVSLEIKPGELMVLVGPSGCGKSTLLRMVAGLEAVTSGTVKIGERVVNDVAPKDRDISMVFQNYALFPHMTVRENLAFGLKFRQAARAEIVERVNEAAQLLHLSDVLDRKPKALSGGQRQRTALGRALVRRPKVFLLDEPLSNLDARMRAEMRAEIAKLHSRVGATMIYVTHDQTEAMTLGDRLCVMNEGRIMQVGAPLEVYQHPENVFVAGFIGSPGMNFMRGFFSNRGGNPVFQSTPAGGDFAIPCLAESLLPLNGAAGKEWILGVRPEDIRVCAPGASTDGFPWPEARIDVVEPMGHETLLHLSFGETTWIVRAPAIEKFMVGQTLKLQARLERISIFDPQSQAAARLRPS